MSDKIDVKSQFLSALRLFSNPLSCEEAFHLCWLYFVVGPHGPIGEAKSKADLTLLGNNHLAEIDSNVVAESLYKVYSKKRRKDDFLWLFASQFAHFV